MCFDMAAASSRLMMACGEGDDEVRPRHAEFDADVEEFALFVMPVWRLDNHSTACDAVEESIELGGFGFNSRRHGVRWFHIAIGDLNR